MDDGTVEDQADIEDTMNYTFFIENIGSVTLDEVGEDTVSQVHVLGMGVKASELGRSGIRLLMSMFLARWEENVFLL